MIEIRDVCLSCASVLKVGDKRESEGTLTYKHNSTR